MKQCIMIDGVEVQYTIETKAILTVLGSVYIYRPVTFIDTLHIVYLGLQRNYGYTFDEFQMAVRKGQIRASKKKRTLSAQRSNIANPKQSQIHQQKVHTI